MPFMLLQDKTESGIVQFSSVGLDACLGDGVCLWIPSGPALPETHSTRDK